MIRRPPRSTRTDTLFPYTTLFRSAIWASMVDAPGSQSGVCPMIKSIPLNKLVQSPRNVRRHSEPAAAAELKASIAAHGTLQNLIVRPSAKGKFEVEAGERRRRGIIGPAVDKNPARHTQVPCT